MQAALSQGMGSMQPTASGASGVSNKSAGGAFSFPHAGQGQAPITNNVHTSPAVASAFHAGYVAAQQQAKAQAGYQ